ncbi:porin [Hyphomicrobium denitrificans ATCC 51888]|uniref:Porin n=1 Tax=Hyphomicrobium denitrificans (strain ATCC 51888 / DSM 1869 / NCIMB 11706 / TK 0415) TaxID=582899 RepID=D8JVH2_HYPDA|nr:outer membrane protein [Hyphomicrobium denitrificans]ADJ24826.1 porin [Hyphomicrobium denitrificans ATCC 51888]
MSRSLLAMTFALAAATPVLAGEPSWTGPYIGAHVGGAWGNASTTDDPRDWGNDPKFIGPFDQNPVGVIAGLTAGYNVQLSNIVLGVEGDIGYLGLDSALDTPSSQSGNHQSIVLDSGIYGAVTARAGFLATPSTLVYGKGGFAFYNGDATQSTTADGYVFHGTGTFTGWVAGGGIEQRLTDNLSIKVEYLHFDFGSQAGDQTSISDPPVGHVYGNSTRIDADTVKAGLNYHF